MHKESQRIFTELYDRYPCLESCREAVEQAFALLVAGYSNKGKLLLCGNGGSAADCGHIAGELMKGFHLERPLDNGLSRAVAQAAAGTDIDAESLTQTLQQGLPALSLAEGSALLTAFANDREPQYLFAQQINVLGRQEDMLLAISTSGTSTNVIAACVVARAKGMAIIGLTSEKGAPLAAIADVCIAVPETETFKIQELHLPVYHALCASLEAEFFSE